MVLDYLIPIYGQKIRYITTRKEWLDQRVLGHPVSDVYDCRGRCEMHTSRGKMLIIVGVFDIRSRLHELTHATQYLHSYLGIKDDEAFAYMLEHLVRDLPCRQSNSKQSKTNLTVHPVEQPIESSTPQSLVCKTILLSRPRSQQCLLNQTKSNGAIS